MHLQKTLRARRAGDETLLRGSSQLHYAEPENAMNVSAVIVLACRSLSDFRLLKKVGEGALSEVYHAQHIQTGTTVAVKLYAKVSLTHFTRRQIEREVDLQSGLTHPHIVQLVSTGIWHPHHAPCESRNMPWNCCLLFSSWNPA